MKLLSEHIKPFPKLMLLTALLLSGFVSATIISAAFILLFPDFNNTPAGGLLVQGICSLVTFGLSALVYFWVFDRDFRFALSLPKDKRLFVWAAVLPICLIPLIDYLNILNGQIHFRGEEIWRQMQETSSLTVERLFSLGGVWGFVAVTFVMAVIPAVVEEFFFRGALQRLLKTWLKSTFWAIVISSAIFSFIHFEIFSFVPRFVMSCIMGALFALTGSIWAGILYHFVNNFVSCLFYFLYNSNYIAQAESEVYSQEVWLIALSIAILVLFILRAYLITRKSTNCD